MRLIKLRIWDQINNKFLKEYRNNYFYKNLEEDVVYGFEYFIDTEFYGNNYIVQQFTGLKDKENKEICEGDIVNLTGPDYNCNYEIIYQDGAFRISNGIEDCVHKLIPASISRFGRIVGNIFENKELLGEN